MTVKVSASLQDYFTPCDEFVNHNYQQDGWVGRKIEAIPAALYYGVIKTVIYLAKALFVDLAKAFMDGKKEFCVNFSTFSGNMKKDWPKSIYLMRQLDHNEIFKNIKTLFKDLFKVFQDNATPFRATINDVALDFQEALGNLVVLLLDKHGCDIIEEVRYRKEMKASDMAAMTLQKQAVKLLERKDWEALKTLITLRLSPNFSFTKKGAGTDFGVQSSLLCGVIREKNVEFVRFLFGQGASLETPDGADAPLTTAVKANSVAIAGLLIQAGADPNDDGQEDLSPLKLAQAMNHDHSRNAMVELLQNPNVALRP